LRGRRARGRFVRIDRRTQGASPNSDTEQPDCGGVVVTRGRFPALLGREDIGPRFRKGRAHKEGDVDGFKLDANHDQPIEADDLPGLIAAFNSRSEMWDDWQTRDERKPWTENWWFAEADAIEREDFNLSASRYRPESREAAEHRNPRELLEELQGKPPA
jgi:hypothetical protein